MPTARKGRRLVNLLISWAAVAVIDALAAKEGFFNADGTPNRSEMIRNMLAYAERYRPMGWRP
ncbi:hypothetical protein AB0B94_30590 [Micromonospora sp. NPDC048986]|uniref:hypothetical protein n=1 Tax=Micromonospora sp. NPDC048986 TaxID=3155644 RepID=UPI0033D5272C